MSPATSKRSSWSIQLPSLVVCLLAASGCSNNVPSASAASRLGEVPTAFALAPKRRASPTTGMMNYPPAPPHDDRSSIKTALMMGSRRGKGGNLKRNLDDTGTGAQSANSGLGQEITGVTLPEEGKIRGWAFGEGRTVACANVDGKYLAVDGRCPRCGFDLYKGKLLDDADVWGPEPHVACPTCAATYSLRTGKFGPEYKATGLAGFVNTWAKTATIGNASKNALAFVITRDEGTGKVYCRER